ncbi:EamA family transporter [Cronobacter muytjensii]|nr:EamA family transporter [Cronobacter muytjensii]
MSAQGEVRRAGSGYAEVMLLGVAVVWGTSYGMARQALFFYPVAGFLFIRFMLTFLILLPALKNHWREATAAGLAPGSVLLAIFLCETFGVAQTSASNAAFLISLCVVLTPFVEWRVFRTRPETRAFIAAGVSLCGALLLTGGTLTGLGVGDALLLGAALLRAVMVCLTKTLTQRHDVPALALTAVQTGVVAAGALAVLLGTYHTLPALPISPGFWIATLYLVLFCTIFAFFAQNYAVQRTTPTRASLLMGTEPLFGALFAMLWLGESLTPEAWLGGLFIVGASLWATRPRRQ